MQRQDIDEIYNIIEPLGYTFGQAMPIIYRKVRLSGGTINALELIERLKNFEKAKGSILEKDIDNIVKKILVESKGHNPE